MSSPENRTARALTESTGREEYGRPVERGPWQVDEPLRVGSEATHHLQSRRGVGLPNRDAASEPGRDDPLTQHIVGVENVVEGLLRRELRSLLFFGQEGPGRLAVGASGGDRNELLLGVAQGGELAAEDAAGVDVHGAVEP